MKDRENYEKHLVNSILPEEVEKKLQ